MNETIQMGCKTVFMVIAALKTHRLENLENMELRILRTPRLFSLLELERHSNHDIKWNITKAG